MSENGTNGAVLSVEGVHKSFGPVHALDGVDFSVRSGEVVALVGDNGAGKSTLVKVIAGIQEADSGRILFDGQPVTITGPTDAVRLGIATVYQDLALCDNLHVVENLFLGHEEVAPGVGTVLRSLDEIDMERRSHELLAASACRRQRAATWNECSLRVKPEVEVSDPFSPPEDIGRLRRGAIRGAVMSESGLT